MTPEEIAADRAVIDTATDGPWGWRHFGDDARYSCRVVSYQVDPWAVVADDIETDADAAFIAAARTGWPRALDALEAAQEGNARLREALDEAIRHKVELDDLREWVAGRCLHYEARAKKAEAAIARVRALCEYVDMLDASEYDAGRMAALDAVLAALDGGAS